METFVRILNFHDPDLSLLAEDKRAVAVAAVDYLGPANGPTAGPTAVEGPAAVPAIGPAAKRQSKVTKKGKKDGPTCLITAAGPEAGQDAGPTITNSCRSDQQVLRKLKQRWHERKPDQAGQRVRCDCEFRPRHAKANSRETQSTHRQA